ncbi:hypothetical protein BLNAU_7991 [Blattamonas nauphoetae]|uniref:Uncharacterized protein n=1 Tax=Blattamonas nauphoetae TaxID=2049346 RepID=A0ABQ9Y093_9EUKA|nr:hypothetical protein BLNAU_7991 [Blattamonas nauphoetae]
MNVTEHLTSVFDSQQHIGSSIAAFSESASTLLLDSKQITEQTTKQAQDCAKVLSPVLPLSRLRSTISTAVRLLDTFSEWNQLKTDIERKLDHSSTESLDSLLIRCSPEEITNFLAQSLPKQFTFPLASLKFYEEFCNLFDKLFSSYSIQHSPDSLVLSQRDHSFLADSPSDSQPVLRKSIFDADRHDLHISVSIVLISLSTPLQLVFRAVQAVGLTESDSMKVNGCSSSSKSLIYSLLQPFFVPLTQLAKLLALDLTTSHLLLPSPPSPQRSSSFPPFVSSLHPSYFLSPTHFSLVPPTRIQHSNHLHLSFIHLTNHLLSHLTTSASCLMIWKSSLTLLSPSDTFPSDLVSSLETIASFRGICSSAPTSLLHPLVEAACMELALSPLSSAQDLANHLAASTAEIAKHVSSIEQTLTQPSPLVPFSSFPTELSNVSLIVLVLDLLTSLFVMQMWRSSQSQSDQTFHFLSTLAEFEDVLASSAAVFTPLLTSVVTQSHHSTTTTIPSLFSLSSATISYVTQLGVTAISAKWKERMRTELNSNWTVVTNPTSFHSGDVVTEKQNEEEEKRLADAARENMIRTAQSPGAEAAVEDSRLVEYIMQRYTKPSEGMEGFGDIVFELEAELNERLSELQKADSQIWSDTKNRIGLIRAEFSQPPTDTSQHINQFSSSSFSTMLFTEVKNAIVSSVAETFSARCGLVECGQRFEADLGLWDVSVRGEGAPQLVGAIASKQIESEGRMYEVCVGPYSSDLLETRSVNVNLDVVVSAITFELQTFPVSFSVLATRSLPPFFFPLGNTLDEKDGASGHRDQLLLHSLRILAQIRADVKHASRIVDSVLKQETEISPTEIQSSPSTSLLERLHMLLTEAMRVRAKAILVKGGSPDDDDNMEDLFEL